MFQSGDFDKFDPQSKENQSTTDSATCGAEGETESADAPHWYGVSYSDGGNVSGASFYRTAPDQPKKSRRSKRVALVAGLVALAVLLSALAGFGGAMLAGKLLTTRSEQGGGLENSDVEQSTQLPGGTLYPIGDVSGYDFGAVSLQKNDGSALADSQNGSAGDAGLSLITAAALVKDSVVEITTTTTYYGTIAAGAGSGVIIHADGIIVTNNHVISGSDTIYVRLTNGNTYEAVVRGVDEDCDIAILKITPKETLTVAKLGYSGALAVGEEVIAIGNPLGELGGTVTNGIISALERRVQIDDTVMTLVQTNAAINSGNSGGGLFNMAGELIGIVNAKYAASGVEGLGFAIPIDTAMKSIDSLLRYGYIRGIPALGATVQEQAIRYGFTIRTVLYVFDAEESSGLLKNDIILTVDGVSVSTVSALKAIIREKAVGDTVELGISRNNKSQTVTVTLVEYIPSDANISFE